jgi:uncharacterized protein YkwD
MTFSLVLMCLLAAEADPAGAVLYPADRQKDVPIIFAGTEFPDPIPESPHQHPGFPVTITFPRDRQVKDVTATLADGGGKELNVWLSTPDEPANPRYAKEQRNTVCLMAKDPLRFRTTYTVKVQAEVDGKAWKRTWSFTTTDGGKPPPATDARVLAALNGYRRIAGLAPVVLNPASSRGCTAHARYLVQNFERARSGPFDFFSEDPKLPAYSSEGLKTARASIFQYAAPADACDRWMASPIARSAILQQELRTIGIGYAQDGGAYWVTVLNASYSRVPAPTTPPLLYPVDRQKDVPTALPFGQWLEFGPPNRETPRGYPITALFSATATVRDAVATLADGDGKEVKAWLSTPERPRIQGGTPKQIVLMAQSPLRPDTTYTAKMRATFEGRPWARTWTFRTAKPKEPERKAIDKDVLGCLNAHRKAAGLAPVERVDADLSAACMAHARYLVRNAEHPSVAGLGAHDEDPKLPGYTEAGRKAGRMSVINTAAPLPALENWIATLYHRLPLLDPKLKVIGIGFARDERGDWRTVVDVHSDLQAN